MANAFIKPEVVIAGALGTLDREVVLPGRVIRDAAIDFTGAKNDTVNVKVPAYITASSRTLRAGTPITFAEDLEENSLAVVLAKDVYSAKGITDEQLTLDITSFATQVQNPMVAAVGRGIEDILVSTMQGATYETDIDLADYATPFGAILALRKALNLASVPMSMRTLAVGANIEAEILNSDLIKNVNTSGSDSALRDATIGQVAGFTVVSVPGLDPDEAYAFHQSAFILATRAPIAPDGATWSSSLSFNGLALRALKDYDAANLRDRFLINTYVGAKVVADRGAVGSDGKFVPSSDLSAGSDLVVRAAKLTLNAGS